MEEEDGTSTLGVFDGTTTTGRRLDQIKLKKQGFVKHQIKQILPLFLLHFSFPVNVFCREHVAGEAFPWSSTARAKETDRKTFQRCWNELLTNETMLFRHGEVTIAAGMVPERRKCQTWMNEEMRLKSNFPKSQGQQRLHTKETGAS